VGRRRRLWGIYMNTDMAVFVIDIFYMIDSDLSKRKGDLRAGIKVGGI